MIQHHSTLIIGCGSIGERHLRCFQKTNRPKVVACDVNPALLVDMTEKYAVPAVTSWEDAINLENFDIAVVCTPAPFHVPMAVALMKRGINTLIEKPLSNALDGVEGLLEAHRSSGIQAAVAYVFHMFPAWSQARDFLRAGGRSGRYVMRW